MDATFEAELVLRYLDEERVAGMVKHYVNRLIDAGEWAEGHEVAVCGGELDQGQVVQLMEMFMARNPRGRDWFDKVRPLIAEFNTYGCPMNYVFVDRDNLIVVDITRMMRIEGVVRRWVTKNFADDGIIDIRVADGKVTGLWGMGYLEPWIPFVVDYEDGQLAEG